MTKKLAQLFTCGRSVFINSVTGYFILEEIYKRTGVSPEIIYNGGKVMSLVIPKHNIRMIDSLNFIPMALSKIPATFNSTE